MTIAIVFPLAARMRIIEEVKKVKMPERGNATLPCG
jgi:hypothetical protein